MVHRAEGKVDRLYADKENCFIRLSGVDLTMDRLFALRVDHPNYNALYSLALSAAINRYTLQIRTAGEIVPDAYPNVSYLVIDW